MSKDALHWELLESTEGPELPLFRVRLDRLRHPTSGKELERMVLETGDWVNVVATTADGRIVMVEQYRFGIGGLTIEPAAGLIDPGESSLEAGKRELLEETGFGGGRWRSLGAVQANPAIQNNFCHHWLAEGVEFVQDPEPDEGEAIVVHLLTLEQVRKAIAAGRIRHSLSLSALSRVFPLWELPYVQPDSDG